MADSSLSTSGDVASVTIPAAHYDRSVRSRREHLNFPI
jgi:hypothetical protein